MEPARAMGTFLRIWRSEWAGLSREQLAIAVSAQLASAKAVSSKVIRKWEDGQPPDCTEQLEGLCRAMRRRALSQPEVEQYRQAVFAACVDRQYPGLFGDDDLAQRSDVDEVAERISCGGLADPGSVNVVGLVLGVRELEQTVFDRLRPAGDRDQERRQEVALAHLKHALARYHTAINGADRTRLARLQDRALLSFLRSHLGGWIGADCNVNTVGADLAICDWLAQQSFESAARLYDMHRQARDRGDDLWAAMWLGEVVHIASVHAGPPGWRDHLRSMTDWHLRTIEESADPTLISHAYGVHCNLAMADRRWAEADRYAEGFQVMRDGPPRERAGWSLHMGEIALAKGRYAEAVPYAEQALEIGRAAGFVGFETWSTSLLRACEEAQRAARRRRGGSTRNDAGAGNAGQHALH